MSLLKEADHLGEVRKLIEGALAALGAATEYPNSRAQHATIALWLIQRAHDVLKDTGEADAAIMDAWGYRT